MNNRAKIWISVIVVAFLVGGVLAWQYFVSKEKMREVRVSNDAIKNETTDWEIYRNEEYGFEMKYPPDLLRLEEKVVDNQTIVRFSHTFPFEYYDDKGDFHSTLTDISVEICRVKGNYRDLAGYHLTGLENPVVISGRKGFKIEMGARGAGAEVYYLEIEPNLTLVIRFYYIRPTFYPGLEKEEDYIPYERQVQIFNQMLSTFRFLE